MENKEEVQSDDGSYELVDLDDYASESEQLNKEAVASSNMDLSDDGSYDFLCSEVSDTLVLTEEEAFYNITVSEDTPTEEMKSLSLEPAKEDVEFESSNSDPKEEGEMGIKSITSSDATEGEMEFKTTTDTDATDEGEMEFKSATDSDPTEEGDMGLKTETNYDLSVQLFPERVTRGKKRNLMTMICQSTLYDPFDYPVHIKLKDDIREVAKNHIIRYLPAKSLAKCRRVSKEWNQWIASPFFAHMQSQYFRKTSGFFQNSQTSIDSIRFFSLENSAYGVPNPSLGFLPMDVSIKSSCNGLLLCQGFDDDNTYYICNPANKQWIKLPLSDYYHGTAPKIVLAFEPSSLNFEPCYQVVCPFSLPDPDMGPIVYFDIYDSKTQSWRRSEMICFDLDESDMKSDGIFVDGIAYWETTGGELLAFDLMNEIYSVQKLPYDEGGALSKVHGELCYVKAEYDHSMRLCMLAVYGGSTMSRKDTMAFRISIAGFEDGELVDCGIVANPLDDVVGFVVNVSQRQNRLYVYHVKDQKVQGPCFVSHPRELFPYVNSLVSLHG